MTNRGLIKNIKKLQAIRPDADWAFSVKQEMMAQFKTKKNATHMHMPYWLGWQAKTALVGSLAIVAIAFFVVFGFNAWQGPNMSLDEYAKFTSSLEELTTNLNKISNGLMAVSAPAQVLEVETVVSATIFESEKFVSEAKNKAENLTIVDGDKETQPKQEVLAALTGVESALSEMKQASIAVQKEIAERELENLRNSGLTEYQQELLEQAEKYFEGESYLEALNKIVEISESR